MVLRILHEVRRTNHYEEEDWSDVAIGEITENITQSHLKLTMQSGKCMMKKTERSTIVMGEITENIGSFLNKDYTEESIFCSGNLGFLKYIHILTDIIGYV